MGPDVPGRRPPRTGPPARQAPTPSPVLAAGAVGHLQREVGNRAVADLIVQRDTKRGQKPPLKVGGGEQQLWVVRDKSIGLGGRLVADLAEFKKQVMTTADADGWTLVLAIHGSEDRLGAQAPPNWQKNAVFYEKSDIEALFANDKAFVAWRDKYGPTGLSLVSCQVSAPFEDALIRADQAGRPGQATEARPGRGVQADVAHARRAASSMQDSKAVFAKLDQPKQDAALDELDKVNQKWGYYGAPPVARDMLTHYYYDEEPRGEWVIEVGVGAEDGGTLKPTGIAFWNRTFGPDAAKFRRLCSQGIGTLRQHKATAPPDVDEE